MKITISRRGDAYEDGIEDGLWLALGVTAAWAAFKWFQVTRP